MKITLNLKEIEFLIESLRYTKLKFESTEYPTSELRSEQIDKVESLIGKLRKKKIEIED